MLHVYHGDGKGKTTAAIGLAVRMLGTGHPVFMVQFLKGSPTGEIKALLKMPGMTILRGKPDTKFVFQMNGEEKEEIRALHQRQLELAAASARLGTSKMLILDEALDAVNTGLLDEDLLMEVIEECAQKTEIVLTGRNPSERILAAADYVTCMKKEKHPYDQGAAARSGVEY